MKIYLARPISGLSYDEIFGYYEDVSLTLSGFGYTILHPMTAKGILRNEVEFKASGYDNPVSSNHAIVERDKWMVTQADVVYANLEEAKAISIGCVTELAWAQILGKHTVVVMEEGNPHQHAFVIEAADIIFGTRHEGIDYLEKLIKGGW